MSHCHMSRQQSCVRQCLIMFMLRHGTISNWWKFDEFDNIWKRPRGRPTLDVWAVWILNPDGWIQHPVDDLDQEQTCHAQFTTKVEKSKHKLFKMNNFEGILIVSLWVHETQDFFFFVIKPQLSDYKQIPIKNITNEIQCDSLLTSPSVDGSMSE